MRYFYSILFLLSASFLQAATVTGSFSPKDTITSLVLIRMEYNTRNDSVEQKIKLDANKKFQLNLSLKEPALFCLINAKNNALVMLVVKPDDVIDLKFNEQEISVSGSEETQYMIDYENFRKKIHRKWLKPVYDSANAAEKAGNKEKLEYWNREQGKAMAEYKSELRNWVRQSPTFIGSLSSIHHSLRWNVDTDMSLIDTLLTAYKNKYPNYQLTRQFEAKVYGIKRTMLGGFAGTFQSTTAEGQAFEFSSVKGNYILLDFWASWCPPCRQESPTLVKLYKEYKDKGFTIVSVSLDDDQKKWEKAIKKDGYTWTNVSDLKGWKSATASLFGITSIPSSFLLDSEGKIIAKNLRGKELEDKLKELMLK